MIPRRRFLARLAALLCAAYVVVSATRFRLVHPWMTETELFVHTLDSLAWRTVERCQ